MLKLRSSFHNFFVIGRVVSEDESYKVEPAYGDCSIICILYSVVGSIRLLAKIHHWRTIESCYIMNLDCWLGGGGLSPHLPPLPTALEITKHKTFVVLWLALFPIYPLHPFPHPQHNLFIGIICLNYMNPTHWGIYWNE